jgi:hypothetical protein
MNHSTKVILVGDNPFHGVSHVSRERSLLRDSNVIDTRFAAELVMSSAANGANGFTFTVGDTTLAILDEINKSKLENIVYYPLVPNVTEMVRTAGSTGGLPGLAKEMAKRLTFRIDRRLLANLVKGALFNDPGSLFKTYLIYEYIRLKHSIGKSTGGSLRSILLHEIVTDMALALDMGWLFRTHIALMGELGLKPGFETRNLPYMVRQLRKWQIDPTNLVIEAPFNAVGFQMCPSRADCEAALEYFQNAEVIAFSVLAAGYLQPLDAFSYVSGLRGLTGLAIGVSNKEQAVSTFTLAKKVFAQISASGI